jgi:hypothetical protein
VLDAAALDALWQIDAQLGIPPDTSVPVLYLESSLNPAAHTNGTDFYGLNQISGRWLRASGVQPSDFLAWSAAEQLLRTVLPYWRWAEAYGPISDPGTCMWAQLAPGTLAHATSNAAVVYSAPSQAYEANKWLDVTNDGAISLGDLRTVLAAISSKAPVRSTIAAAYAQRGQQPVAVASRSSGSNVLLAALVAAAGAAAVYVTTEPR